MNPILETTGRLPLVAVTLGIGLAVGGWILFPETAPTDTATLNSRPASTVPVGYGEDQEPSLVIPSTQIPNAGDFPGRAAVLRAKANSDKPNAISARQIREFLAEWANSDPEASLAFALKSTEDGISDAFFRAADSALSTWARNAPEQARAYMESVSDSPQIVAELAPAMMRLYAEYSPRQAQEWVQNGFQDDSGELRPVLARELISALVKMGRGDEVQQWLVNIQVAETAYALPAVCEYSRILAESDVDAALNFSKKLPRGTMSRCLAIQNAVQVWASRDAGTSYNWVTAKISLEDSSLVASDSSGAQRQMPAGAYNSDDLDYAISGYVLALASTSRKEAVESAAGIEDASLRRRILQQVNATTPDNLSRTSY